MPRICILAELPLNHRERIQAALKFEEPDRVPCHETPRDLTLAARHEPGMPRDVPPADYFGFDLTGRARTPTRQRSSSLFGLPIAVRNTSSSGL